MPPRNPGQPGIPEELPEAYVSLAPPPPPPPLPLVRRKATADLPSFADPSPAATGPYDYPYADARMPETLTPFASTVDAGGPDDFAAKAHSDTNPEAVVAKRRFWPFKRPSRSVWVTTLVAVLSAGSGWAIGAKPWVDPTSAKAAAGTPRKAANKSTGAQVAKPRAPNSRRIAAKGNAQAGPKSSTLANAGAPNQLALKQPVKPASATRPAALSKASTAPKAKALTANATAKPRTGTTSKKPITSKTAKATTTTNKTAKASVNTKAVAIAGSTKKAAATAK